MSRTFLLVLSSIALGCSGGQQPEPITPAPAPAPVAETPAAPADPVAPDPAQGGRDAELTEQAMRIIEAFANHSAALSPDGKQVVFVSTRDGLSQLYLADARKPDAPATRLVESKERCGSPLFTLDGRAVIYRSDRGADEYFSIFRVDLETAGPKEHRPAQSRAVTELTTDGRLRRSPPVIPDGAGGAMFFTAGKAEEREVKLFRGATDGSAPAKLVYTDPGPGALHAVSRDGKQALVARWQSLADGQLFLVDVEAGTSRQIYPPQGKQANIIAAESPPTASASWSPPTRAARRRSCSRSIRTAASAPATSRRSR